MSKREREITKFLNAQGWGDAQRIAVPGDASSRRYERLVRGNDKAILMDTPMSAEAPSPYLDTAKLAGNDPNAFICLAKVLTRRGLSAPHVLAADLNAGLVLLEDFGEDLFSVVLARDPAMEETLYSRAVSVLAAIYRSTVSPKQSVLGANWTIQDYDRTALLTEADLFLDWYMPEFETPAGDGVRAPWYAAWRAAFKPLDHIPNGLVLRDYHADNIFWLPQREGLKAVGLIDFQDALFNHPAYDLVSLIEDARRDVAPALAEPLKAQFCQEVGIKYDKPFKAAYAALAAQRNAKILGIFVRLSVRDKKHRYRDWLPRVRAHFLGDIRQNDLPELREWVEAHAVNLASEL